MRQLAGNWNKERERAEQAEQSLEAAAVEEVQAAHIRDMEEVIASGVCLWFTSFFFFFFFLGPFSVS